jgi:hypothetical protein
MKFSLVAAFTAFVTSAAAFDGEYIHLGRLIPPVEPMDAGLVQIVAQNETKGSGFFDQLLDHNNPSKGTFKQKFWWNIEFWDGPGSPVSLQSCSNISRERS